eukprot:gnl/MRDRNA2_/MRDRNA2_73057_c0_seq1.p1 gnl/MRDRNA2_/MRDRNA2_73057_c0~~gnl/MRDRNA2_/MRDRNA2_73057_c0_seq1.p1  ORF type:complete len:117 (+),score=6.37 gnl/MRDRNA2_/MRDRNA2_73057_c0_seq1:141-491(+)
MQCRIACLFYGAESALNLLELANPAWSCAALYFQHPPLLPSIASPAIAIRSEWLLRNLDERARGLAPCTARRLGRAAFQLTGSCVTERASAEEHHLKIQSGLVDYDPRATANDVWS